MAEALIIPRNRDVTIPFSFTSGASPVNITGKTITFNLKRVLDADLTDANLIFSKTMTIVSGAGGTASVSIVAADTATLAEGQYYFDVQYDTAQQPSNTGRAFIRNIVKNEVN